MTSGYNPSSNYKAKIVSVNDVNINDESDNTFTINDNGGYETGTVTDIDGNVYQTIKIGNQWWMAENLKVTHYRNGNAIPNVTSYFSWRDLSSGAYCAYNNDNGNADAYGMIYNWYWYAVDDSRNIAPIGWHVPTDEEWKELEMYLGLSQTEADDTGYRGTDEGDKLKATTGWYNNGNGTNESGFTALPGIKPGRLFLSNHSSDNLTPPTFPN